MIIILGGLLLITLIVFLILPKGEKLYLSLSMNKRYFSQTEKALSGSGTIANAPSNLKLTIIFKDPSGHFLKKSKKEIRVRKGEIKKFSFSYSLSDYKRETKNSVFEKGRWEIRVYINKRLIKRVIFEVKPPEEIKKMELKEILEKAVLTTAVDFGGKPLEQPKTIFLPKEKIYLSLYVLNPPSDTKITTRWIYLNQDKFISKQTLKVSETQWLVFSIDPKKYSWLPLEIWPEGRYKVEIWIEDEFIKEINFRIKK